VCNHAKLFWTAAKDILLVKLPRLHPVTWVGDILCDLLFTQKEREIIITVMYSIWTSRNNLKHGEAGFNPAKSMEVIQETSQMLELPKDKGIPKPPRRACKWSKPPDGTVKPNSDAALQVEYCMALSVVVARDDRSFRGALCRVYTWISIF
jgi:hypothetical protein